MFLNANNAFKWTQLLGLHFMTHSYFWNLTWNTRLPHLHPIRARRVSFLRSFLRHHLSSDKLANRPQPMDHDAADSPIWQAAGFLSDRGRIALSVKPLRNHGQIGQPANKSHPHQGRITPCDSTDTHITREAVKCRNFLVVFFFFVGWRQPPWPISQTWHLFFIY